jgi:hypothetical protein
MKRGAARVGPAAVSRAARVLLLLAVVLAAASPAAAHPGDERGRLSLYDDAGVMARAAQAPSIAATPRAACGPGSREETDIQGRVPAGSDQGFICNLTQVGRAPSTGGFKTLRFKDKAGHECAYYDTALLFPLNATSISQGMTGVAVLDMSDPAKPVRTTTLSTPAMQTPHESLNLNEKRGLLAAVTGNPAFYPGVVDIYDVNEDCRKPVLQSSLPVGVLGHESGFSLDGNTFYTTSLGTGQVTALDVSDPKLPKILTVFESNSHGLTLSDDGNRAYIAAQQGLVIMDVSEIQARKPNPQVREVSRLAWPELTIPQIAIPVTIGGRPYVVEVDEFSQRDGEYVSMNGPRVGAARIIDIADETRPRVVSNIRLEVNQPENRAKIANDPGAQSPVQGYAGHYCNVPRRAEPGIFACSFIASGLRVFDIRDPQQPKEIAYFVAPAAPSPGTGERSNYAMSQPAFAPERDEVWYTDGNSGFYALRLSPTAGSRAPSVMPPASNGLPRTCRSRRAFRIRLRRGLVAARVYVNGKRVRTVRGRRLRAPVDLRGLPRGRFTVRVVGRLRSGRTVTARRTYRTCVPQRR